MTTEQTPACQDVQMAALARLDGEVAALTSEAIDAHVAGCLACQLALPRLRTVYQQLDRMELERTDQDLWPAVQRRLAAMPPSPARQEGRAILGLAAVLVLWRLAQLLLEVPAPVVNSVVPLVLIVFVLKRLSGDPFAIRPSHQFQQRVAP